MQVVFHLGAHSTDEDRLIRTLADNPDVLAAGHIAVPAPNRYRLVLRDALLALRGDPADQATQDTILAACTDDDHLHRIVFSHDFFLCVPARVISDRGFYTMAGGKLAPLANLFPQAAVEFHMALINPATLIPALEARQKGVDYEKMMCGRDPRDLRWAPVVRKMVEAAEGRPLVIWCNEDLPLIWPEVLRRMGGIAPEVALAGEDALIAQIMSREGLIRLRSYFKSHPPQSITQRRKVVSAFLGKFARPETLEVEIALPGWTEALIEEITAAYEEDVAEIAAMEGVEFIAP